MIMRANLMIVNARPSSADPIPTATPSMAMSRTKQTNTTGTPTKRTRAETRTNLRNLRMAGSGRAFGVPTRPCERRFRLVGASSRSVDDAESQEGVGVELAPVRRIAPDAPHAFTRVQDETARGARPRLRCLHLSHRPLDPASIDDHVRIFLVGRASVGGKHMAVRIDTPGHQIT